MGSEGDPARPDRRVLYLARGARGFGAGGLSIVLALDLASAGDSPLLIGVLLGLALGFGSVWALLAPRLEAAWGRRSAFRLGAVLLAAGGFLLWADVSSPWVVLVALGLGGVVAGASDVGPLGALEQATLADSSPKGGGTAAFAVYNLVGYLAGAFGSLIAAPISPGGGFAPEGRDVVLLLYGLLGVGLLPAYASLSARATSSKPPEPGGPLSVEGRRAVRWLASLFAVDAFGGGLIVNSLVVYYLSGRFHPTVEALGLLFFLANVAAAASLLLAVPIARRIGLVRTMVFTHLPSSVLLVAFAAAPGFLVAAVLWVARSTLSQMDVPTRQAFTQALVPAADRASAAGLTTAARSASALGGPVTGAFLGASGPWIAGPFVLAGGIKIAYDLAVYGRFHAVPVDEQAID